MWLEIGLFEQVGLDGTRSSSFPVPSKGSGLAALSKEGRLSSS